MSDQSNVETFGETSETDSDDWDVVQHKDVQASGNSSDGESVEIINEEEASHLKSSSCDSRDELELSGLKEDNRIVQTCPSDESDAISNTETSSTESNADHVNLDWFNAILSEQKEIIYICLTIFIVVLAMFIAPKDERFVSISSSSGQSAQDMNIENLIEELQKYRESNEILKLQVKQLSEVVNAMGNMPSSPKSEKQGETHSQNQASDGEDENIYFGESFTGLKELINFTQEFSYLSNATIFKSHKNNNGKRSFNLHEMFQNYYNGSLQKSMELFFEIPKRLKELSLIVTQHKNVQPFVKKWGPKLNTFSRSIENDLEKMKLNFAKHILKSLNRMVYSFYKQICYLHLNDIVAFKNCDEIQIQIKEQSKRNDNKSGRKIQGTLWKTPKKFIKIDRYLKNRAQDHVMDTTAKGSVYRSYKINPQKKEEKKLSNLKSKSREEKFNNVDDIIKENIVKNLKHHPYEPKTTNQATRSRTLNQKLKHLKYIRNKPVLKTYESINIVETEVSGNITCKQGSMYGCNLSDTSKNATSNWFINMGNQRSKIRSHQSRGDWIFDRAKARRENTVHETYRQFYRKRPHPPPYFNRDCSFSPVSIKSDCIFLRA